MGYLSVTRFKKKKSFSKPKLFDVEFLHISLG